MRATDLHEEAIKSKTKESQEFPAQKIRTGFRTAIKSLRADINLKTLFIFYIFVSFLPFAVRLFWIIVIARDLSFRKPGTNDVKGWILFPEYAIQVERKKKCIYIFYVINYEKKSRYMQDNIYLKIIFDTQKLHTSRYVTERTFIN